MRGNYRTRLHMAESSQLLLYFVMQRIFGSAYNKIGGYTQSSQLLHSVLSRFCFLFPHRPHHGNQANMDETNILTPHSELKLSQSLYEWRTLYVPHSSSKFNHACIWSIARIICRKYAYTLDPILYFVGYVGYDLNSLSKIVPSTLPFDDRRVHFARG